MYEVRLNGSDIVYTDAKGDFLIQGEIIDVQKRTNLTKDRIDKLSAIDFKSLPFKDSFTIVRGNGKRKMAVFADPNCGYCKRQFWVKIPSPKAKRFGALAIRPNLGKTGCCAARCQAQLKLSATPALWIAMSLTAKNTRSMAHLPLFLRMAHASPARSKWQKSKLV